MSDIRLVDLDVFKRYSLAIRQESAPVEEVLAILDVTRRQVLAASGLPDEPWAPAAGSREETGAGWGGDVEEWAREEDEAEAAAWAGLDDVATGATVTEPPPAPSPEAAAGGRRGGRREAAVPASPEGPSEPGGDEATWAPEPAEAPEPPAEEEPVARGDEPAAAAARRRRPRPTAGDGGVAATVRRRR